MQEVKFTIVHRISNFRLNIKFYLVKKLKRFMTN